MENPPQAIHPLCMCIHWAEEVEDLIQFALHPVKVVLQLLICHGHTY